MTTKPSEGLFIRRSSSPTYRKVHLSRELYARMQSSRVRVLINEFGVALEPCERRGGGSRAIHKTARRDHAFSHAELYRALPDGRLYLLEIGGKFVHHRMLENVA